MGQERLNSLALLAIERDLASKLDLEEAVDRFAAVDQNTRELKSLTSTKDRRLK